MSGNQKIAIHFLIRKILDKYSYYSMAEPFACYSKNYCLIETKNRCYHLLTLLAHPLLRIPNNNLLLTNVNNMLLSNVPNWCWY